MTLKTDKVEPTPEALLTKLKNQGFFDDIRKQCLENAESYPEFAQLKADVEKTVFQFLAAQVCTDGNKFALRTKLRQTVLKDHSFQQGLMQISQTLLTKHASPEILAPTINQMACDAHEVDYNKWLKRVQRPKMPEPLLPAKPEAPVAPVENPSPLLPSPTVPPVTVKKEPLLPLLDSLTISQPAEPVQTFNSSVVLDVDMEVDNGGDEMELDSEESNGSGGVGATNPLTVRTSPFTNVVAARSPHLTDQTSSSQRCTSLHTEIKNSSSFSRKVSAAASAAAAGQGASSHVDTISDDEMELRDDYSPLRRRLSQQSSLPVKPASIDRNPSPDRPQRSREKYRHYQHHQQGRDRQRRDRRNEAYRRYNQRDDRDRHRYSSQHRNGEGRRRSRGDSRSQQSSNLASRSQSPLSRLQQQQQQQQLNRQRGKQPIITTTNSSTVAPDSLFTNPIAAPTSAGPSSISASTTSAGYHRRLENRHRGPRDSPHANDFYHEGHKISRHHGHHHHQQQQQQQQKRSRGKDRTSPWQQYSRSQQGDKKDSRREYHRHSQSRQPHNSNRDRGRDEDKSNRSPLRSGQNRSPNAPERTQSNASASASSVQKPSQLF